MLNILEIIAKKRDGKKLTKEEIEFFINEYVAERVTDYQAAALVMAIYINSMDEDEITNLTLAMANSGEVLDLSEIGQVIDKHSTGGVGDKITLILMPIIAACGIPVAKMSGRGLGFTGGTIDKLEAIPNYNTNINIDKFISNVKTHGISLMGQTMNLAPADKKIYALRDTIACTDSIPLIASSIMSKKIAAGANKIVIDVTVGSGAFMKNVEDAKKLAKIMETIGKKAKRETKCIITDMNQPLGYAVGNTLEVVEAVDILKNKYMPEDIEHVIKELASYMILAAGIEKDKVKAEELAMSKITDGSAYKKLVELVKSQGGDESYIEDTMKFKKAKYQVPIRAKKDGVIERIDAYDVGTLAAYLGAGRMKKEDKIEPEVGFVFFKKAKERATRDEIIGMIHANDEEKAKEVLREIDNGKIY